MLSAAGLGAGSVSVLAPLLRPLALALTAAAVLVLLWSWRANLKSKNQRACCNHVG
jgi:hypothetical protein